MSSKGSPATSATGSFVESKFAEFEARIRALESRALADFVGADNWVKRNCEWIIPVAFGAGMVLSRIIWS